MQYKYKVQQLLDSGVNFSNIFPEKQESVKEMTGFDFNLSNIVSFLKNETDNFSKTNNSEALDIDRHINAIYLKSLGAEKPIVSASSSESEVVVKLKKEVSDLKDLIEMESDKKKIKILEKEISDLNDLIEMES